MEFAKWCRHGGLLKDVRGLCIGVHQLTILGCERQETQACLGVLHTALQQLQEVLMHVGVEETLSVITQVSQDAVHLFIDVATLVGHVHRHMMAVYQVDDATCGNLSLQQADVMVLDNKVRHLKPKIVCQLQRGGEGAGARMRTSSTFNVNKDDGSWYAQCQDIIFPEEELNDSKEDEALGGWFKITIPNGRKYSKMWIMNLLQSHCTVAFTPIDFHYTRNKIQFFVQNARSAYELKNINYQISDEENRKISIHVNSSTEPLSVQYKLTSEQMQILKLSMKKRYDVSHKSLYLGKFRFDPDLRVHGIDIFLNRRSCMTATLQVIQKDFPEVLSLNLSNNRIYWLDGLSELIERAPRVKILNLSRNFLKTTWELEKMKGLKLKELWLEGNPLCSTFPDHSAYDGCKLFPTVEADTLEIIKPRKESYRGSESLKNLVVQFMLQYYLIYDYGDRRNLLAAYHANACFSLTITFNSNKPDIRSLEEYFKDCRNMKRLKDSFLRLQLLKHNKCNIVTCLHELPKTQHDLNSYIVDIWAQTEKMICFSVNGVFKESKLCIVNDEMILRNASPAETKKAFSTTTSTISHAQSHQYLEDEWYCIGDADNKVLGTYQRENRMNRMHSVTTERNVRHPNLRVAVCEERVNGWMAALSLHFPKSDLFKQF
ncbi:hypothetical protein A6R68_15295 [Neotoma lepida]|uniref:NTF2 domain-containing protein n=1 Tax=Neotoma lepida TaxID=56216 RepID=A0A1A6H8H8_NEOLE|nr:hypothetical protein A6R68_15295 [Neotoma lepida]